APSAADLLPPPESEDSVPLAAAGEETEGATDPAVAALLAQQRATTYQAEKTSQAAAAEARQDWLDEIAAASDTTIEVAEENIDLPLVYERRICLDPEPGNAQVGLWLSPDPENQPPLELIKSSGYPFINQNAMELVSQAVTGPDAVELPAGTAYVFNIEGSAAESGCVAPEEFLKQLSEPLPETSEESVESGATSNGAASSTPTTKPE
ncbi:hypothetical protein C7271_21430, partial [filamentous cyanobacterium CCP5]